MTCKRCRKDFAGDHQRCPHCGAPKPEGTGLFQTSTVLISTVGADLVYRSLEEVPTRLRTQLLKSTNGANSATILIADQRGRKEIAKVMRRLPGPAQRRLMQSVFGTDAGGSWLTPVRKWSIVALVAMTTLAVIAFAFLHRY